MTLFIERRLYHLCLYFIVADIDEYLAAFFGEFIFYITHTDSFLQRGRLRAGSYFTDIIAIRIYDLVIMARYAAIDHFKANQLLFGAFSFLLLQGCRIGEFLAELGHPAQACFQW